MITFSTPTHYGRSWLEEGFRRRMSLATKPRRAFVGNRTALVGQNAAGEWLAQFDEPPQDHGWHLVEQIPDFIDETLDGELSCASLSAAVETTKIEKE